MTPPAQLKLRARDADDLEALSACLQDALVCLCDMAFLPADRRFAMVLNRFRWETPPKPVTAPPTEGEADESASGDAAKVFERVHSGLCFDAVEAVRVKGIDLRARDRIFELLAIRSEPDRVLLHFAGGAAIELTVGALCCHLQDLDESWPTRWRPRHPDLTRDAAAS